MAPWTRGFDEVRALRRRGPIELHAGRAAGRAQLLLVAAQGTATIEALRAIAAAHGAIRSPHVPALAECRLDERWIALDCDAITDAESIIEGVSARGQRIPYAQGIAFNEVLMDAVEAAHAAGCSLQGALCLANLLVGRGGKLWLVGFGHNFSVRHGPVPALCVAPEISVGKAATEASDVYVLHALVRALLPVVEMLPLYADALEQPRDGPVKQVRDALVELANAVSAVDPALRPPNVAALRARYREIRRLAGTMPEADFAGLEAFLASAVSERSAAPLFVSEDVRRVRLGAETIDLTRRRAPRLILARLVDAHRAHPGSALDIESLARAGWPGERMLADAARARVYVTISTLRKLGLEEVLIRRDDGYLLDPQRAVERLDPDR